MPPTPTCRSCGSTQLEPGKLGNPPSQTVPFHLDNSRHILLSNQVHVKGLMCMDCGAIELVGDREQAAELLKEINVIKRPAK